MENRETEERDGKGWTEKVRDEERRGKRNRNELANSVQGRMSRRENDTSKRCRAEVKRIFKQQKYRKCRSIIVYAQRRPENRNEKA